MAYDFALFETPIGHCGIAWGGRGIAGVQLPEGSETATRARLLRRFPDGRETTPPLPIRRVTDGIAALLRGEAADLSSVILDMDGVSQFHRRVYEITRDIPRGATLSYGDVAARLGASGAARAVGQALGRNPFAILVLCHRVVAAGGRVGGFSASGGVATKLRLLSVEAPGRSGALFDGDGELGFDRRAAVEHVRTSDAALRRVIDRVGPFQLRPDKAPSTFTALAEAVVYQQLTAKAAAAIFARLRALFPRAHEGPAPGQILRASDAKLRSVGLSRAKVLSLRDLARREAGGEIPTLAQVGGMEDEAIIERLTVVRGVGRWTVEMLLIFRLGRPDVLPIDDYGIRKGFATAFRMRELPSRAAVAERGARWKPYRTVASWYLWRAAEWADARRDPSASRSR